MYLDDLGDLIAFRELNITGEGKLDKAIKVMVGKPLPFPDSGGYYCPFQIVGVGGEEIKYAAGVDSIQALQLVMVMIGATLQYLNSESGNRLCWEGSSGGDLGFPAAKHA